MLLENGEYLGQLGRIVEESGLDFGRLDNKAVLVTGAAGMLGSGLVDVLIYLNEHKGIRVGIYALGRNTGKFAGRFGVYAEKDYFHPLCMDISKEMELDEKVDYMIHAASNADPAMMARYPVDTLLANVVGMNNLLSLAVKNGAGRVLYVSSGEMYGQPPAGCGLTAGSQPESGVPFPAGGIPSPSDGQSAGDRPGIAVWNGFYEGYCGPVDYASPRSCYPSGKRAAEVLCQSYISQYGMDAVIVRPCHCYGPTMTATDSRALSQFFRKVIAGEDIVLKSDGTLRRSHCYVVDAVSAMFHVLLSGACGEAYNIADRASEADIKTIAGKIAAEKGKKVVFDLPDEIEKKGFSKVTCAVLDGEKLERLGWRPKFSLGEGIASTVRILENEMRAIKL